MTDRVGAELLQISRDNFRQKLARARRDLHHSFMEDKCGLIRQMNPCRCARKTQGFVKAGLIDVDHLLFARHRVVGVREVAEQTCEAIDALDAAYAEIHRNHPFQEAPDFVARLRRLMNGPDFMSILELH